MLIITFLYSFQSISIKTKGKVLFEAIYYFLTLEKFNRRSFKHFQTIDGNDDNAHRTTIFNGTALLLACKLKRVFLAVPPSGVMLRTHEVNNDVQIVSY